MASIVPINTQTHAQLHWQLASDYRHAASQLLVPVAYTELALLAGQFVLGFIKQSAGYQLVALLAVQPGKNLYIHPQTGQWLGHYVPAHLRGYPFTLGHREDDPNQPLLCIDEAALLSAEQAATVPGSHPLFNPDGSLSPASQQRYDALYERLKAQLATQQATAALAEAGLIQPWNPEVELPNGARQPINGLFQIDEPRLQQLDDATYLKLRHAGALPLAYAQIIGKAHSHLIGHRAKIIEPYFNQPDQDLDLDRIFGDADDEMLKFD